MLEGHARQPVDAQVHVFACVLQAGQVESLATGCPGADEHRIVILVQYRPEAVDFDIEGGIHPHLQDVVHLFVEHLYRQSEGGYLAAHHAAARKLVVVDIDDVTQGSQVPGDGQGGRTCPDQGDAFTVLLLGYLRQPIGNGLLVVCCNALQPADGDRLLFHTHPATGGLTGPVTGPAQNAREDIGVPIDHVGIGIALCRNQSNVFGDRRVRRAGVLAIHHFVKVLGVLDICRFHAGCSFFVSGSGLLLIPTCKVGFWHMSSPISSATGDGFRYF